MQRLSPLSLSLAPSFSPFVSLFVSLSPSPSPLLPLPHRVLRIQERLPQAPVVQVRQVSPGDGDQELETLPQGRKTDGKRPRPSSGPSSPRARPQTHTRSPRRFLSPSSTAETGRRRPDLRVLLQEGHTHLHAASGPSQGLRPVTDSHGTPADLSPRAACAQT